MGRFTLLLLTLFLVLGGCRSRSLPSSATDPVRIGVVLPQTGDLGTDGQGWLRGVQLAVDEVNAAGGVLGGRPVELVVADSNTATGMMGVDVARSVVDQGVAVLIGDGGSAQSLAIYQAVTHMEGVPQISGSSTSISLTVANMAYDPNDRYFFRTAPSDRYQAQVVVRVAHDTASCTRLAIFHLDDAYGTPMASAIEQGFDPMYGSVVANVGYMAGQSSYTDGLSMVAAANPDCVVLIGYPVDAGIIVRNWAVLPSHPTVQWIGTDGLETPAFITQAAATDINGFIATAPQTQPPTAEYQEFARRYRATYGGTPDPFVSSYYDATVLALLAIEQAGTTDGAAVRAAIADVSTGGGAAMPLRVIATGVRQAMMALQSNRAINYEGASGPVDFDANGDTVADYGVWQVMTTGGTPGFVHLSDVLYGDLTP